MKLTNLFAILLAALVTIPSAQAITIDMVPVGNPGNAPDTRYIDSNHPNGVGSVAQYFNIGKTEVTNAQYLAFLSAVALSDPYGLYDTRMGSNQYGGIVRNGISGSYSYSIKAPALSGAYSYDNKPVVYVSSGDAMRFVNWLNNGQPTGAEGPGTTETGAYSLNGATEDGALAAVSRNAGALWWLPNENEWYKAAFHDPYLGIYYDYPTRTNNIPNNNQPSSDTGNSANFYDPPDFTTGDSGHPLTDVGAYTLSGSPYGTFDQAGSVWEWNETLFNFSRGIRGGAWENNFLNLRAMAANQTNPAHDGNDLGFRVAGIPEPSTALLVAMAALGLLLRKRTSR